jgi:hypothetical protein
MTHDEITKPENEETTAPEVTDGSLSDTDLEQVAGGRGYVFYDSSSNIGTRTGGLPGQFRRR